MNAILRPFLPCCLQKSYLSPGPIGPLPGNASRRIEQVDVRQGGLQPGQKFFSLGKNKIFQVVTSPGIHVCIPCKFQAPKICNEVATPPSFQGGLSEMHLARFRGNLCKYPLDNNSTLVAPFKREPPPEMSSDLPLLGFNHVVAPINKASGSQSTLFSGPTISGDVYE